MPEPLRIWLLSDAVPGHVNQARGLVRRISVIRAAECREHIIPMRFRLLRPLLRWALNRRKVWASRLVGMAYSVLPNPDADNAPHLIVSAGGNTSFASTMLAQQFGCANFFMGSLRGLDAALFTAVFSLQPLLDHNGDAVVNNVVMPILPPNNDEVAAAHGAAELRQKNPNKVLCAVLLGGDGSGYRFKSADWQDLARAMNVLSERHGIAWLLTTSRRTGAQAEQALQTTLRADSLAEVVWYHQDPRNRNNAFLQAADLILCSEDSMSMLHEALATNLGVVTLTPIQTQPPPRYREKIQRLLNKGHMQQCAISALTELDVANLLVEQPPQRPDWREELDRALSPYLDTL